MGDTTKCLVYVANLGCKNIKSGRSYASFGEDYSEIDFTEACSGKLVISLSRVVILRRKVKGM